MRDFNVEYNLTKIFSNSEQSNSNINNLVGKNDSLRNKKNKNNQNIANSAQTTENNFDIICLPCITSKQTRATVYNKAITKINKKFDKIHVNLWGLYNPTSLFGTKYAAILSDIKIIKT